MDMQNIYTEKEVKNIQKKLWKFWIKLRSNFCLLLLLYFIYGFASAQTLSDTIRSANIQLLDSNFISDYPDYKSLDIMIIYSNRYANRYSYYDSLIGMMKKTFVIIENEYYYVQDYIYNRDDKNILTLDTKKREKKKKYADCMKKSFRNTNNGVFLQVDSVVNEVINNGRINLSNIYLPSLLFNYDFEIKVKIQKGKTMSFLINSSSMSSRNYIIYNNKLNNFPNYYYMYFPYLFKKDCKRINSDK